MENDIDHNLLLQFSCMGTTDKEELIKQLQTIVGYNLSPRTASFFLEMNNWNLQGAVGSYFDANHSINLPSMSLLRNLSVVEEEIRVLPGASFCKSWEMQNTGGEPWPSGCCLVFSGGRLMTSYDRLQVSSLQPGSCTTVEMLMLAPDQPGIYESKWRMSTNTGSYFGDTIWLIITVVEQSLGELTQQLSSLSSIGAAPHSAAHAYNPFNATSQGGVSSNMDEDGNMLC